MGPQISLNTLGVGDLRRALVFYHDGLGWPVSSAGDDEVALLKTSGAVVSHYARPLLAEDAAVPPEEREGIRWEIARNPGFPFAPDGSVQLSE